MTCSWGNPGLTFTSSRPVGEAIIEPVITTLTRTAPDNHLRAIPDRSVTRARCGSAGRCYRRPFVGGGVVFRSGANRVSVRIRAAPDDELFARPGNGRTESWRRGVSPCDRPPHTGNRVIKAPISQWAEARVNPAPDKQIGAIPARRDAETR